MPVQTHTTSPPTTPPAEAAIGPDFKPNDRLSLPRARLPERVRVVWFAPEIWSHATPSPAAGPSATGWAAEDIAQLADAGSAVFVAASANPRELDAAAMRVARLHAAADTEERAALLATPEIEAAGHLAIDLSARGLTAMVLDPAKTGPVSRGPALDAEPRRLDVPALARGFARTPVLIQPGGLARDESGRTTYLGREGAELAAVFAADRLACPLRLVVADERRLFVPDDHDGLVDLADGPNRLLSRRAALYARRRGVPIEIAAAGRPAGAVIGDHPAEGPMPAAAPAA